MWSNPEAALSLSDEEAERQLEMYLAVMAAAIVERARG